MSIQVERSPFTCVYCGDTYCISETIQASRSYDRRCPKCDGLYGVVFVPNVDLYSDEPDARYDKSLPAAYSMLTDSQGNCVHILSGEDLIVIDRAIKRMKFAKNPTSQLNAQSRRRARKLNAEGVGLSFDIETQLKRQKGKCYYCQCKLNKYHVDHVVPLNKNGSEYPDNKVLACPHCNLSKGDKLPHEWVSGGRLL